MRHVIAGLALAVAAGTAVIAQNNEIIVMGGRNQDTFLGCITCGEHDVDSVWNQYGRHGWQNKFGTWNRFGQHANPYGANSACNQYGSQGPILVDRQGNYYGHLSVNEHQPDSVCGPRGVRQICIAVKVMCADS